MFRYFLEVSYKGTAYSGFQSQHNTGKTIQAEIERAFLVLMKDAIVLVSSSRTDAGVHALQNFFHFDTGVFLRSWGKEWDEAGRDRFIYKLNAILPPDIVARGLAHVADTAHCRFDASGREYRYYVYRKKDPFLQDRAFYFPYKLDTDKMQEAAAILREYTDFTSFSKRNTQVKSFICKIETSEWVWEQGCLVYHVKANRFLRGMVRALTATMLKIGRGKLTLGEFRAIIEAKDCTRASFAVPAHGLFLVAVQFP
jgi:tRNA pseudouridine38-40 synthase